MRYRYDGKEKTLVMGPYPEISLTEARARRADAKMKLLSGIDPAHQKQAAKRKEKEKYADTFEDIFAEWHSHKSLSWSPKYRDEMLKMFQDDILPMIGHLKITDVEPMMVLGVVRKFEERGAMERADKARRRCGEVFRYAVATGRVKYNPAPELVNAMWGYRKEHFPFPPMSRIHEFNRAFFHIWVGSSQK